MPETKESSGFNERFRSVVDRAGGASALARRLNIPLGSLNSYLKSSEPTVSRAFQIADACSVSCRWLATGEGNMVDDAAEPAFQEITMFQPEVWNAPAHFFSFFMVLRVAREYHNKMNLIPTLGELMRWISPYYIGHMQFPDWPVELKSPEGLNP